MKWAGSLFLAVSIVTCMIPSAGAASVEGVVRYLDNTPAARVSVEIGDSRAVTDNYGNFVMWLDPGVYVVRVDGRSCEPQRFAVTPRGRNRVEIICEGR